MGRVVNSLSLIWTKPFGLFPNYWDDLFVRIAQNKNSIAKDLGRCLNSIIGQSLALVDWKCNADSSPKKPSDLKMLMKDVAEDQLTLVKTSKAKPEATARRRVQLILKNYATRCRTAFNHKDLEKISPTTAALKIPEISEDLGTETLAEITHSEAVFISITRDEFCHGLFPRDFLRAYEENSVGDLVLEKTQRQKVLEYLKKFYKGNGAQLHCMNPNDLNNFIVRTGFTTLFVKTTRDYKGTHEVKPYT